eukprot:9492148-Pyramimonas_sp.AAC.1
MSPLPPGQSGRLPGDLPGLRGGGVLQQRLHQARAPQELGPFHAHRHGQAVAGDRPRDLFPLPPVDARRDVPEQVLASDRALQRRERRALEATTVCSALNELYGVGSTDLAPNLAQEEAHHQVLSKLASVPGSGKPVPFPHDAFREVMRTDLSYASEE